MTTTRNLKPSRASRGLEWVRAQRRTRLHELRFALETFAERHRTAESKLLEIGCGHGHWLSAYAAANPKVACFGIDLKSKRIRLARQKVEKYGLGNLEFLKADAIECLEALPGDLRWDYVCMLFLDPWPKAKHHKNRLIQQDFLSLLAQRVNTGARLYFRTDHAKFFSWTLEHLEKHPGWGIDSEEPWIFEHKTYFQELMSKWHSAVAVHQA